MYSPEGKNSMIEFIVTLFAVVATSTGLIAHKTLGRLKEIPETAGPPARSFRSYWFFR